ncbi:hypothetical protein [Kineothrix sedimenti]|uniref:Uncharacterized protein n=1 Tax=Kineothrix sedimenti TaxID=3123317 RepID=A0ABZ3ETR2_9FIRM
MNDGSIELVNDEIYYYFEKWKILICAVTDYIAGITDGYALEESEKFGSPLQFYFVN